MIGRMGERFAESQRKGAGPALERETTTAARDTGGAEGAGGAGGLGGVPRWMRRRWAMGLVVAVAAVAAHLPSVTGGWVFDDIASILGRPAIRAAASAAEPVWHAMTGTQRPLTDVSFAATLRLQGWDGGETMPSATPHRVVNVAIHALAAVVLMLLVRDVIRGLARRDRAGAPARGSTMADERGGWWAERAGVIAGASALLWAVHPLTTQAVGYVVQRSESLASLLGLACVWSVVRASVADSRRAAAGWAVAALVAAPLSVAAKPVLVGLVVLTLIADRAAAARTWGEALRRRWWLHGGVAAGVVAAVLATGVAGDVFEAETEFQRTVGFAYSSVDADGHGPTEHLLTQGGVILRYVWLVVWPDPLVLDYGWEAVDLQSGVSVWTLAGVGLVGLLVAAALVLAAKRPALGLAALGFFVVLGPTSSFVPVKDVIFEHRMYLPSAALLTFVVVGAAALVRRRGGGAGAWRIALIACVAAAIALGVRTGVRAATWGDFEGLAVWRSNVADRPDAARAWTNLGLATVRELERAGVGESDERWDEAIASLRRAVELDEGNAFRRHRLSRLLDRVASARGEEALREEAIAVGRAAAEMRPGNAEYWFDYGAVLDGAERGDEAAAAWARAWATPAGWRNDEARAKAAFNLGVGALRASERAGRSEPPNLREALSQARAAEAWFERVLGIRAEDEKASEGVATARRIAEALERMTR